MVTREVHRSSLRRLICPAQDHFIFLTVYIISMSFVLSLTQMLVLLSLYVMLSILLSILVCAAASLFCACLLNSNILDHQILQTDLIQLEKWSDKWQMQLNILKCVHLPVTNKTKPISHQYSLFGHPLSKVASHANLGVKLHSKLSWANHITEITTTSPKVFGMVKRTLCH